MIRPAIETAANLLIERGRLDGREVAVTSAPPDYTRAMCHTLPTLVLALVVGPAALADFQPQSPAGHRRE